jgi:hypothetical protein
MGRVLIRWLGWSSIVFVSFLFSFEVIWVDLVVGEEWKAGLCLRGSRQRTLG